MTNEEEQVVYLDLKETVIGDIGLITAAQRFEENCITMCIDKPDQRLMVEFKAEGIWVNGVQKDVDSEWPEIYEAFKQFVTNSPRQDILTTSQSILTTSQSILTEV